MSETIVHHDEIHLADWTQEVPLSPDGATEPIFASGIADAT